MEQISDTLLAKLFTKYQTVASDSNPHMEILVQKAAKFINQGTFLAPQTVRTGNILGRLDVTIRRESHSKEPTEIIMIYIEDGLAKIATMPYVNTPDDLFTYKKTIGLATDVACDFDGQFKYISDRSSLYFDTSTIWALETFGEPYFALVYNANLILYHGTDAPIYMATDVIRVSLLRGWQSITDIVNDQGLICAYLKTDGKVYYRNYCEMSSDVYGWSLEKNISELPPNSSELALFRTADYRVGFIVETDGVMKWAITKRNWSGMANPPENISASILARASLQEIIYRYPKTGSDKISILFERANAILYALSPVLVFAENISDAVENYGKIVIAKFDERIFIHTGIVPTFEIEDTLGNTFTSDSVLLLSDTELKITFYDFNNAQGQVRLSYVLGALYGDVESVVPCYVDFIPQGLVPVENSAPNAIAIANSDQQTIDLEFDGPVNSNDWNTCALGFEVSGYEYNRIPGGSLEPVSYKVLEVNYAIEQTDESVAFEDGELTNVVLSSGEIMLEEV